MHGRFSITGGARPGCPPKVYAYAYEPAEEGREPRKSVQYIHKHLRNRVVAFDLDGTDSVATVLANEIVRMRGVRLLLRHTRHNHNRGRTVKIVKLKSNNAYVLKVKTPMTG